MKRYFIYIIMVVATLVVGCTTDQTETPPMVEVGDIEVTYSVDGEEIELLSATPQGQILTVNVNINYPGIYWTPTSDKEWCQVVEEPHYGNGTFKLNLAANTGFYAREEATITFTAGEYKESVLKVTQEGNVFFIDKHYTTLTKGAATTSFKLSTPYEFEFEASDWISTQIASQTTANDASGRPYYEYSVNANIAENTADSRFGHLYIKRKGESEVVESIHFWQYGTDVEYDNNGNILIAAQSANPFEVRIPTALVENVTNPSWAALTVVNNDDETTSYLFTCEDNPSDASHIRDLEVEFSLFGNEAISLSFVKQNYYDVGGIISGHGLALLAKTFNEGGNCDRWKTDGKLVILNDIDMADITEWTPIGTATKPFDLEFDGGGKKILNFKGRNPFFGTCSGATISNFVFDESCELSIAGNVSGNQNLAPLASAITNKTVITECIVNVNLAFDNMKATTNISLYVGGLVARADATSSITNSKYYGTISLPEDSATSTTSTSQGNLFVGGIVSHTLGTVESCTFGGTISHNATIRTVYIGGVTACCESGSILKANNCNGTIAYNSPRKVAGLNDASRFNYSGGIVGQANGGEIEGNTFNGRITSTSSIKTVYLGGIVGRLYGGATVLKNNSTSRSSKIIMTGAARYTGLGGLVALLDANTGGYSLDFTNDTGSFEGMISGGSASDAFEAGNCYMGGIIGESDASLTLVAPKWSGSIDVDHTADVTWYNLAAGGIVGAVGKYSAKDTPVASTATISGAVASGEITVSSSKNNVKTARASVGGILGWNNGGLTLTDSSFTGSATWLSADARQNSQVYIMGGLVGSVDAGNSTISNCHNQGVVFNWHYNNNGPANTGVTIYTYNYTGGIIGAYGCVATTSGKLTMENCSCNSALSSYRGGIGGMAGYVANATINNCRFTGGMTLNQDLGQYNSIFGGVVGIAAANTTISNCVVRADMNGMYAGSCPLNGGGLVAIMKSGAVVENCKFYGNVDLGELHKDEIDEYCGGLVGHAESGAVVRDCAYGGYVRSVYVNSDELAVQHALGTATVSKLPSEGTATNITHWNGEE